MVVPSHQEPVSPGQLHFKVSLADFTPRRPATRVVWGALLGGVGVAGLVWVVVGAAPAGPSLVVLAGALMFLLLGMSSLLSVFVRTPA